MEEKPRQCSSCNEFKSHSAFYKKKASVDGLNRKCIACLSIETKKRYANASSVVKTEGNKVCLKCGEEKHVSCYVKSKLNKKDGLHSWCKGCANASLKEYAINNKEKRQETNKKSYMKHKDKRLSETKEWVEKNREWVDRYQANYREKNKDKRYSANAKWRKENREVNIEGKKVYANKPAIFDTYIERLRFYPDEHVRKNKDGHLEVQCTYCGRWFIATNRQVANRLSALAGNGTGESRFYDTEDCKESCPIYKQVSFYKGERVGAAREVPPEFRRFALEYHGYECQKCGDDCGGLHVHHIDGATELPMFAADIKNVIVVCRECHIKIHQMPGCTNYEYSCRESVRAA